MAKGAAAGCSVRMLQQQLRPHLSWLDHLHTVSPEVPEPTQVGDTQRTDRRRGRARRLVTELSRGVESNGGCRERGVQAHALVLGPRPHYGACLWRADFCDGTVQQRDLRHTAPPRAVASQWRQSRSMQCTVHPGTVGRDVTELNSASYVCLVTGGGRDAPSQLSPHLVEDVNDVHREPPA